MGNLRYFDHSIALAGFQAHELTFFSLGFGWLALAFIPKRLIIPGLYLAAAMSAAFMSFQFFIPMGFGRSVFYMAFRFFNGLSAACAFYLFCFLLNNIERLFGMALIQLYYGFFYIFLMNHADIMETWNAAITAVLFLSAVFFCREKRWSKHGLEITSDSDGKGSPVPLVVALGIVHYMIMCMTNFIEWTETGVSNITFAIGIFVSVGLVFVLQMLKGRNAMYIWLLFLVLSLLGLGILLYDTKATFIYGSLVYGLGDSLGYIIISYMCSGAIKRSRSLRMFRLYCVVMFAQYAFISGLFSIYFSNFDSPNKFLAFGDALVLVSLCLLFMPLIQKKLFDADWTDGLYLRDMDEYAKPFVETETLNAQAHLNLTPREEEIFTMLLGGSAPKEIAHTLKISFDTVRFHQKNLYRKLGIQSIQELFAKYSPKVASPT